MKKIRTLIVDDSVIFRSQIRAALEAIPGIEIAGVAANGRIALGRMEFEPIDLVILDLEMPEMNGLETLQAMQERRRELKKRPKVLVFSSGSKQGTERTLEALRLGAADFVSKPSSEKLEPLASADPSLRIQQLLAPKIREIFSEFVPAPVNPNASYRKVNWDLFVPKVVVIGCSTGGPAALEYLFSKISGNISLPILIVQHMPPVFTASLAERLAKISGLRVSEAKDNEKIEPNRVYVAPGDYHMRVALVPGSGGLGLTPKIALDQGTREHFVRPAVDPLFASAAQAYPKQCLGFILTGMGEDGLRGAMAIKQNGGAVMIQDASSCVVYGMPKAVFDAGAFDQSGNLDEVAALMTRYLCSYAA
jgi:two-component system chemotaxis response regulator CheB